MNQQANQSLKKYWTKIKTNNQTNNQTYYLLQPQLSLSQSISIQTQTQTQTQSYYTTWQTLFIFLILFRNLIHQKLREWSQLKHNHQLSICQKENSQSIQILKKVQQLEKAQENPQQRKFCISQCIKKYLKQYGFNHVDIGNLLILAADDLSYQNSKLSQLFVLQGLKILVKNYVTRNFNYQIFILHEIQFCWSPQCSKALQIFGSIYNDQRQYQKSLDFLQKSKQIFQSFQGNVSKNLADIQNSIGLTMYSLKKEKEAKKYFYNSEVMMKQLVGQNHRSYASVINNHGLIYYSKKDFHQALEKFLQASQINQNLSKGDLLQKAIIDSNIGATYLYLYKQESSSKYKEYSNKSEQYLQKSLSYYKKNYKLNHERAFITIKHLGWLYYKQYNLPKAQSIVKQAINIIQKTNKKYLKVYPQLLNIISLIMLQYKKYDQYINYTLQQLQATKTVYGKYSIETAKVYLKLCQNQLLMMNYQKAKEYLMKAQIILKILPQIQQYIQDKINYLKKHFRVKQFKKYTQL